MMEGKIFANLIEKKSGKPLYQVENFGFSSQRMLIYDQVRDTRVIILY